MALSQKQLIALREAYLLKREEILQGKVDTLAASLFDKMFNEYLSQLEQSNGRLVSNGKNISQVRGLDEIFSKFNQKENIPVVKSFIKDLQGITPINEVYFKPIANKPISDISDRALEVVNNSLGINSKGTLVKDGFADKFIKDDTLLKKIKSETLKAITQKKGFQQFKEGLKETIQGVTGQPLSGGLQQYYRNYAYDTFHKVDRINAEIFAKDLGLIYFYWSGGLINTSRALCIIANGKIFNSIELSKLNYDTLQVKYRDGISKGWVPLQDLGMHGCRHRKDYISTEEAIRNKAKWFNINSISTKPIKKFIDVEQVMNKAKKAGKQLDTISNNIAKKNGSYTSGVNYKSANSIERKVETEYDGDVTRLKDAARTTIVSDSKNIGNVLFDLKKQPGFVAFKTQDHKTDDLGYSGNIVSLKASNGTLMEVQVNTSKMIYAKEQKAESLIGKAEFDRIKKETGQQSGLGHTLYEEYRLLNWKNETDRTRMIEIQKESKKYYSNFI